VANQVLRLYVDTARNRLVESSTSEAAFGALRLIQGDTVTLVIQLLEPNPSGGKLHPYSVVPLAGLTLRVGAGLVTSAVGTALPTIYQTTWAINTTLNTATGTLYNDPTAMAGLLAGQKDGITDFEIEVSEGGNFTTVFYGTTALRAELLESGTPGSPPAGETYLTANESIATFLTKAGVAGESKLWISADGAFKVLEYLGNDGMMHYDPVT